MTRIYTAIHIDKPIDAVFDYVTTPGNWPRWHPSSLRVSGATDHSLEVGEQVTEEFRVAGRHGHVVWTVRERTAPTRWVIEGQIVGRATGGTVCYRLAPNGSGTRFARAFTYPTPNLTFKLLDWLLIRRRVQAESEQAVRQLKATLEAGATEQTVGTNDYYFLDEWFIPQPIQPVWERIVAATDYPAWWGMVYDRVEPLNDRPEDQVGARSRVVAHGRLPYRIRFVSEVTHVDPPHELRLIAQGDLTGGGTWRLNEVNNGTMVTFEWIVRADKPIIRTLSPLLKPIFAWNHRWTMRQGEAALQRLLATEHAARAA